MVVPLDSISECSETITSPKVEPKREVIMMLVPVTLGEEKLVYRDDPGPHSHSTDVMPWCITELGWLPVFRGSVLLQVSVCYPSKLSDTGTDIKLTPPARKGDYTVLYRNPVGPKPGFIAIHMPSYL